MPIVKKTYTSSNERRSSNFDKLEKYINETPELLDESTPIYSERMVTPTVTMLDNNEDFQNDVEKLSTYFGSNQGVLASLFTGNAVNPDYREFLRDGDWRLTSVIDRAIAMKDAPEEVKEAYRRVRNLWDDAKLDGYGQYLEAIKDGTIDAVTDPFTLVSMLTVPLTGGGTAAAATLAKEGVKRKAMQTLSNIALSRTAGTGAIGGGISGAAWSGVDDFYRQQTELSAGMIDEFSNARLATAIGVGGTVGVGLGAAIGGWTSKAAKKVDDNLIPENRRLTYQGENVGKPTLFLEKLITGDEGLPFAGDVSAELTSLLKKIPIRSASIDEAGELTGTRGFPVDLDINKWEVVDEVAARLSKKYGGGEATQQEIADILRSYLNTAKRKNLNGEQIIEGLQSVFLDYRTATFREGTPLPTTDRYQPFEGGVGRVDRVGRPEPDRIVTRSKVDDPLEAQGFVPKAEENAAQKLGNRLLFNTGRVLNKINATILAGRATDLISPYTKHSKVAAELEKRLRYDSPIKLTGSKVGADDVLKEDYFETFRTNYGKFVTDFKFIYEPIVLNAKGELGDNVNNFLIKALRTGEMPEGTSPILQQAAKKIRTLFNERGVAMGMEDIPENYMPRLWKRSAIENNQSEFESMLVRSGYDADEANSITESMINKNMDTLIADGGPSDTIFLKPRVLEKITNDDMFSKFLENDLRVIVNEYGSQSSRRIAKQNILGIKNEGEFKKYWLGSIKKELQNANFTNTDIAKAQKDMLDVYRSVTGENLDRFGSTGQSIVDAYSLGTRVALLPLATLSSLTEIFINVSKSGIRNTAKGFFEASENSFKTVSSQAKNKLLKEGYTEPEIWREMQEIGLAMDQAAADVTDRLAGEALSTGRMRKLNNVFFRANMLDQWTKFVQMSSYISGKNMIVDNIEAIGQNQGLAASKRIMNKRRELAEFGIKVDDALTWYNGGMKTDDPFMQQIQKGAGRYTNEVILNPSAASGLKPLLHSNPKSSVFFLLMGYPAAFTNTILKKAVSKMVDNPVGNVPKTFAAAYIMTETARFTNWARSHGTSEEDGPSAAYQKAFLRWGGAGSYLDMFQRAQTSAKYYDTGAINYIAAPFGPLAGDALKLVRTGNIAEFAGTKVPGYGALSTVGGQEALDNYRKFLRDADKKIKEVVTPEEEKPFNMYAKGGVVLDVPQAPEEPDERIDKMTGLPYNEQAGTAFIDEEDRQGFALGGNIAQKVSKPISNFLRKALVSEEPLDKIANPKYFNLDEDSFYGLTTAVEETKVKFDLNQVTDPDDYQFDEANDYLTEVFQEITGEAELESPLLRVMDYEEAVTTPYITKTKSGEEISNPKVESIREDMYLLELEAKDNPEIMDMVDEVFGDMPQQTSSEYTPPVVSEASRNKSRKTFTERSDKKEPVYRATSSGQDTEFDIAIAGSDEIGMHVGSSGSAHVIAKQAMYDKMDAPDFLGQQFTKKETDKFFKDHSDVARDKEIIKPIAMQKGYIQVRNPLELEDSGRWDVYTRLADPSERQSTIRAIIHQSARLTNMSDEDRISALAGLDRLAKDVLDSGLYGQTNNPVDRLKVWAFSKRFREELEKLGYDSIKYKNKIELSAPGEDPYSYILFRPNQFKTSNASLFDINDPRSNYVEGGKIAKSIFQSVANKLRKGADVAGTQATRFFGMNPEDIQWAKSLGMKYGQQEELDGRGDAARHLALGWLAKNSKRPETAKFFINAREVISNVPEREMDQFNNNLGFAMDARDRAEAEERITKLIDEQQARYMTPSQSQELHGYAKGGYIHPENFKFLESYHDAVVRGDMAGKMDGKDVTMYIRGLGVNGKEYLLPSYDPESGTILSAGGTRKKFKKLIDSGVIKGYDNPKQAEEERRKMYDAIINKRQQRAAGGKIMKACSK
jgi:hypothetical protein